MAAASQQDVQTGWLWPDNVRTWSCWQALQSQWRVGATGRATGLDYAGVRAWLLDEEPKRDKRAEIWRGIQACERAVMEVAAEKAALQNN